MKRVLRQILFCLGSTVIFVLAVPMVLVYALICGISTLMDRVMRAMDGIRRDA